MLAKLFLKNCSGWISLGHLTCTSTPLSFSSSRRARANKPISKGPLEDDYILPWFFSLIRIGPVQCSCFPYRHALAPGTAQDHPEENAKYWQQAQRIELRHLNGWFSPPPACSKLVSAPASVAPPLPLKNECALNDSQQMRPGAHAASPPLWSAS